MRACVRVCVRAWDGDPLNKVGLLDIVLSRYAWKWGNQSAGKSSFLSIASCPKQRYRLLPAYGSHSPGTPRVQSQVFLASGANPPWGSEGHQDWNYSIRFHKASPDKWGAVSLLKPPTHETITTCMQVRDPQRDLLDRQDALRMWDN